MTEAYPLQWPPGWKRTQHRRVAAFKQTRGSAIYKLLNELRQLEAKKIVLSSNLRTYNRGGVDVPYADQPGAWEDPGIAVYFELNGHQQCIPCDKWKHDEDNIHAIGKTVEALRGIERWGAKEMVDAAFKGFKALPGPDDIMEMPNRIDYFGQCLDEINGREKYKELVKKLHPDTGGNSEDFNEMQRQWSVFKSKGGNDEHN